VIEALSGAKTAVVDPYLIEVRNWGYQELQQHQKRVVDTAAALAGLQNESNNLVSNNITNFHPQL